MHTIPLPSVARVPRQILAGAMILAAMLVPLWFATQASALEPTGDFAVFKQCPRFSAEVNRCLYAETLSGEVTIGKSTVPINTDKKHPIILQAGINEFVEPNTLVAALNGETLSKTPQPVPGGLAGLVNCNEITEPVAKLTCVLVFQNGLTGVTATTELAKPASSATISASNLINEEGTALSLPLKVKLDNPLLGSACYIGSSSSPVTLNLTSGATSPPPPNTSIHGKEGTLTFKDGITFQEITNNTLVDNSFSAPAASGCGGLLAPVLDPIINLKLGLPSPAGKNTAIQNNTVKEASGEVVIKSEK
jgi:hypothetical protein